MKSLISLIIALGIVCSLSSCRRSARNAGRLLRSANNAINSGNDDKPADYNPTAIKCNWDELLKQKVSKSIPIYDTPIALADSSEYKCYTVVALLPEDTTNYLDKMRNILPYQISLNEYQNLKIEVRCHLRTDSCHEVARHVFHYRNGKFKK